MTEPKPGLTRDGAVALVVVAAVIVISGTVAILAESWKPAGVGVLLVIATVLVGVSAEKLRR